MPVSYTRRDVLDGLDQSSEGGRKASHQRGRICVRFLFFFSRFLAVVRLRILVSRDLSWPSLVNGPNTNQVISERHQSEKQRVCEYL